MPEPLHVRCITVRGDGVVMWGADSHQGNGKLRLALAGVSVVVCSACNLATPIVSGILFEILTGRQPMARYPYFLGLMATLYAVEPLLTRVYIQNVCMAGEKVGASLNAPVAPSH